MAMNIPKGQVSALGKILEFNQEQLSLLFSIIRDAKPDLFIDESVNGIVERLKIPEKDSREIARTLYSVFASRVANAHKTDAENFLKNICDTLKENGHTPADGNWEIFKSFIAEVLKLKGAIEVTSKALSVLLANERNCSSTKIVTDLRPVFCENPADEPAGAVIVHMLKIEYNEGDVQREFSVALDSRDILSLKQLVERALIKEATILKMTAKLKLPVVRPTT